jgi:hypothetical protein
MLENAYLHKSPVATKSQLGLRLPRRQVVAANFGHVEICLGVADGPRTKTDTGNLGASEGDPAKNRSALAVCSTPRVW